MPLSPEELIRRRHPVFLTYYDDWEFLRITYEGGGTYRSLALDRYSDEELIQDWGWRLRRAAPSNYVKHIIDEKRNLLFNPGVKRSTPAGADETFLELWGAFNRNFDGRGTSRDDFMRRVYSLGTLYSWVMVLVDKGAPAESVGEAIKDRKYPYCLIFTPQQVLDWSTDQFGHLRWVLLRETSRPDESPWEEDKKEIIENYLLWTTREWTRIRAVVKAPAASGRRADAPIPGRLSRVASGDATRERREVKIIDSGENPIGEIPAVIYRDGDHPSDQVIGDNAMVEIAGLQKRIFNQTSNLDEQIVNTIYAFLAIVGGEYKITSQKLGPRRALQLPQGGGVSWVGANISAVDYILRVIDRDERIIYQKAKLRSGYGEESRPERMSGVAHQWDWRITNDDVADDARMMEKFEREIDRLFGAWEGQAEFGTDIQYERNFSVLSSQENLMLWQGAQAAPLAPTAMAELHKRTVRALVPRMEPDKQKTVDSEIDANPSPAPIAARRPVLQRSPELMAELERRNAETTGKTI